MVANHPYRVLGSFSYDEHEKPLRSERIAETPPQTDTGSYPDSSEAVDNNNNRFSLPTLLRNISPVIEHDEFVQLLINTKTQAQVQNSSADVTWRGYTTTISPDFDMSRENVQKELLSALRNMIALNEKEKQV